MTFYPSPPSEQTVGPSEGEVREGQPEVHHEGLSLQRPVEEVDLEMKIKMVMLDNVS